jgi:AbrB family looped-hinge helix DNA binding protein
MDTTSVKVEKSGRILIPAAIRRQFNLKEGTEVILRVDDTGIQMSTREQALTRIRAELRRYIPADGRLLSEELIAERRAEAEKENQE